MYVPTSLQLLSHTLQQRHKTSLTPDEDEIFATRMYALHKAGNMSGVFRQMPQAVEQRWEAFWPMRWRQITSASTSTSTLNVIVLHAQVQTLNQIFDGSGVAVTISLYKTPSVRPQTVFVCGCG